MGKTEDKWNANYDALKAFVETYRLLSRPIVTCRIRKKLKIAAY